MNEKPFPLELKLYKTPQTLCPYLPDQKEQLVFTHIANLQPDITYDLMTKSGFRRSHGIMYKPDCKNCSECLPIRINVKKVMNDEGLLNFGNNNLKSKIVELNLSTTGNLNEAGNNLYDYLHFLDNSKCKKIAVAPIPNKNLGKTINDRLIRASSF